MNKQFYWQRSKEEKGFAIGVVLALLVVILGVGGTLLFSGLQENKQAALHSEKISSHYAADSGAKIVHMAFKKYLDDLMEAISFELKMHDIRVANGFLDFLQYGGIPLESAISPDSATFHLNLNANNSYYLTHSPPISDNHLVKDSPVTVAASVTMVPLGPATVEVLPTGEVYIFPLRFHIKSQGKCSGAMPGKTVLEGEGTAFIRVSTGLFGRFALFTHIHETSDRNGHPVWFTENTVFEGPVFTNGTLSFKNTPTFNGKVYSHNQRARFFNGRRPDSTTGNHLLLDSDRNGNIDVPDFKDTFHRGVKEEKMPDNLDDMRWANLQGENPNNLRHKDYHFSMGSDGNISGGLYFPADVDIELIAEGDKQRIRTQTRGKKLDFVIDYKMGTTTVYNRLNNTIIEEINSIPNGTIFSENNITSLKGIVQKDSRLSVAARNNIYITDNILYEEDHIENPDATNILGIMSEKGDVIIPNNAPHNLTVSGTVMTPHGSFRVHDYTQIDPKGTLTLHGGVISYFYGAVGTTAGDGYGRNFIFDKRMGDLTKMPLGFPATESMVVDSVRDENMDTLDLIIWKESK